MHRLNHEHQSEGWTSLVISLAHGEMVNSKQGELCRAAAREFEALLIHRSVNALHADYTIHGYISSYYILSANRGSICGSNSIQVKYRPRSIPGPDSRNRPETRLLHSCMLKPQGGVKKSAKSLSRNTQVSKLQWCLNCKNPESIEVLPLQIKSQDASFRRTIATPSVQSCTESPSQLTRW